MTVSIFLFCVFTFFINFCSLLFPPFLPFFKMKDASCYDGVSRPALPTSIFPYPQLIDPSPLTMAILACFDSFFQNARCTCTLELLYLLFPPPGGPPTKQSHYPLSHALRVCSNTTSLRASPITLYTMTPPPSLPTPLICSATSKHLSTLGL